MTDSSPQESIIGHVDGSTAATTGECLVVLEEGANVQLDDLIVTRTPMPNGNEAHHYGIVDEIYGRLDGATIPSDTPRIAAAEMAGEICRTARVVILRTNPERFVPPLPGAVVRLAQGEERSLALFEDQMDGGRLCLGVDQAGLPVHVDFSYVNGQKGAHFSVSGVSGVAAKTSFAMTALYSLFETDAGLELLGREAPHARALVFNVKGEDLMFLDRPNSRFDRHPDAVAQWRAMGVAKPGPFTDVGFYAPCRSTEGEIAPAVNERPVSEVGVYGWSPEDFIRLGLLPYLFGERQDRSTQVDFVEQRVRLQLARFYRPVSGRPGAVTMVDDAASMSNDFEKVVASRHDPVVATADDTITDFRGLVDYIAERCDPSTFDPNWSAGATAGTLGAFLRRLFAQSQRVSHLIRDGLEPVSYNERISVVDIHALHDSAQRFVVGAMLSQMFAQKRGREPLRFVVLDELNKYAPKEGSSPIKEVLIDIAARGRSLGVILIGAQQSASSVDPTVTSNAAIKVVGRLDAAEADSYRFLSSTLRDRASRFLPGTMILAQPLLPAPVPIRVPFPPFATNVGEATVPENPKVARQVAQLFGD